QGIMVKADSVLLDAPRDYIKNTKLFQINAVPINFINLAVQKEKKKCQKETLNIWAIANKYEIELKQLKTVTRYMISTKAHNIATKQEYHILYSDIHECKFSHKWVDEYVEEQQNFLSYVLYLRTEHNYPLNLIGNMDETLIAFNMPITLACLADSTKLPLLIIFKLVNMLREQFPDSVYVRANPSSWMNEKEMICSKDSSIFDFGKISDEKGRISIKEEKESNELSPESAENENDKNDHEHKYCEYYEGEEGNYINIWN
ncbi:6747_t:CDS:2, partial [Scutellospora calospora]